MSSEYPEFIADNDYRAQDADQLSFRKGNRILILDGTSDWWFGRNSNGDEGWIPPSYGHIDEKVVKRKAPAPPTPYAALTDTSKLSERDVILADIINTEYKFVSLLQEFIETVILPIEVRDTQFKRNFMDKVASSFTLLLEIHKACSTFLNNYRTAFEARNVAAIGSLFLQFASSLRLFGQYITLNSNLLNEIKSFQKGIADFLLTSPLKHGNIETYLILPLQHYLHYLHHLSSLLQLTPTSNPDHKIISGAHDLLAAYSAEVDDKLQDEKSKIELLSIQSQFIGNPKIYRPSRIFIRAGDVERIGDEKKTPKHYMAHLFNDAFMYSSYVGGMGRTFKFHKVFDLLQCTVDRYKTSEHLYAFQLKSPAATTVFRCTSDQEAHDWVTAIQGQIDAANSLPTRKSSMVVLNALKVSAAVDAPSTNTRRLSNFQSQLLQGIDASTLGSRASIVYNFLRNELEMAENLVRLYQVMIRPLIDASKGAALIVGQVEIDGVVTERDKSLFEESNSALAVVGGAISRMQAKSITDTLQAADMQIFLLAAESLTQTTMEFLSLLETRCISARWQDAQCLLGDAFVCLLAENINQQYISYVNGYLAALRIMESSSLQKFKAAAERVLSPQNFTSIAAYPRYAVVRYIEFNQRLLSFTPTQHAEYKSLNDNIAKLTYTLEIIDNVLKIKKNYEKLLSISSSFVTLNVLSPDPVLTNLVSNERTFIKEGTLIKVCRKKNKPFQFFLFNDYLLYGSPLPNGLYQYSRSLDLTQCQVEMKSVNGERAFEILSTEKSFMVIADTSIELTDWFDTLTREIAAIKKLKGVTTTSVAPVWVADSASDGCCVCKMEFRGFFNRKHHCRMCGLVVCGEHSKSRLVLPNIHKTEKQRVCDTCFHTGSGKSPTSSVSTPTSSATTPTSPAPPVPPKPSPTSAPTPPPKPPKSPAASAPPVPPRPYSGGSRPLPAVPKPSEDEMPSTPPPPVPTKPNVTATFRASPPPPVIPSTTSHTSGINRVRESQLSKTETPSPTGGAKSVAERIREAQLHKSENKPQGASPSGGANSVADRIRESQLQKVETKPSQTFSPSATAQLSGVKSVAERIRESQLQKAEVKPSAAPSPTGGAKSVAERIREAQLQKTEAKSPPASLPLTRSPPPAPIVASAPTSIPTRESPALPSSEVNPTAPPPKPVKPTASPKAPESQPALSQEPAAPITRPPPPPPKPMPDSAAEVPPPPPPRDAQPPPPAGRRPSINNPPPRPPPPPPPRAPPAPESNSTAIDIPPARAAPTAPDPRNNLLMSIQAGSQKLRTVSIAEKKEPPKSDSGGILGMLATMIVDRRISMMEEDVDDDDSDSGFSDSDSD